MSSQPAPTSAPSPASPTRAPLGRLVVLSGASGSGKSTLVARLLAEHGDLPVRRSISTTTRAPRPGEVAGVNYLYTTRAEFEAQRDRGEFLEWAEVHDHYYGTAREPVDRLRAQGFSVILVIDVQGAMTVRAKVPDALLIFVQAPSFAVLAQRLRDRATDSAASVELRLKNARREVALANAYDHQIVNEHLDHAVADLATLLKQQHPHPGSGA